MRRFESNTLELMTMFANEAPPRWRLLHRTPDEWDYRNAIENAFPALWKKARREPYKPSRRNEAAEIGELFSPTALRVEALMDWTRTLCANAPREAGLDWVQGDMFSPPSPDAVTMLFGWILAPRLSPLIDKASLATFRITRANMLALCFWELRQRNLIDADTWGAVLRCIYVIQRVSLQTSVALPDAELVGMFRAAGDIGFHSLNTTIKSRKDLPATITLYRGVAGDFPHDTTIRSWTDAHDVALLYAARRQTQGRGGATVIKATFHRNDIAGVIEHGEKADDNSGGDYREWLTYPDAQAKDVEVTPLPLGTLILHPELWPVQ